MNKAKWIQSPNIDNVSCFKKIIYLRQKLKKATLKITSMGFYRVYINKKDISDNVFMPGWTSFLNRVQYQTYDITYLLKKNNALEMIKSLNELSTKEEALEAKIKNNFKLDCCVEKKSSVITATCSSSSHNNTLANNLMRTIQEEFDTNQYITIKFES